VNVNGELHSEDRDCPNSGYDNVIEEFYCRANALKSLDYRRKQFPWMPSTLEYYWQSGIDAEGFAFLNQMGFVYRYE